MPTWEKLGSELKFLWRRQRNTVNGVVRLSLPLFGREMRNGLDFFELLLPVIRGLLHLLVDSDLHVFSRILSPDRLFLPDNLHFSDVVLQLLHPLLPSHLSLLCRVRQVPLHLLPEMVLAFFEHIVLSL